MRSIRGRLPSSSARAAVAAVLAAAVLGTVSACTGGGASADTASDGKSLPADGSTSPALPPGKYQTLPQPCASVDPDELKKLVPGAKDYAGDEALTYDTDRRVGCAWHGAGTDGSAHWLTVDLERVVSYDPGVSDEVQAESDFDQRAQAASIPLTPLGGAGTPTGTSTGASAGSSGGSSSDGGQSTAGSSAAGSKGANDGSGGSSSGTSGQDGGSGGDGASAGTTAGSGANSGDGTSADPSLAPRRLTDLGNAAFINDVLKTPAAGPRRTVTVVFRTANVVVSVTYVASAPKGGTPPQSADLQKSAQQVAVELQRSVEK